MLPEIIRKLLIVVGLGGIFVAGSEFWFYPVDEGLSSLITLLAYGVLAYGLVIILSRLKVKDFWGFFLLANLFGFMVEGAIVPYLYSGIPLTIVWTSMAWHALLTVSVGWYLVYVWAAKSVWLQSLFYASVGLFLGGWNTLLWGATEVEGTQQLVWSWMNPLYFSEQFLFGTLLFIGGHILFRLAQPSSIVFTKIDLLVTALAVGAWGGLTIVSALPLSLIIVPLVLVCMYPVWKSRFSAPELSTVLEKLDECPVGIKTYLLMLIIPLFAIPSYWLLYTYQIELEWNALLIVTAGPISLYLFSKSFVKVLRG